jgi:hypothetical protein
MTRCPSDLDLERHLLDPVTTGIARHLDACAACTARLARMRREGDDFRRYVFPATVDAVVERSRPRRRVPRWLLAAAPLGAIAAAAVAVLAVRPPADYVGTKGGPLGLTVWVQRDGAARATADGDAVPAAAALRFEVRPERPCRLWIVSLDAAGEVSRLYPPAGDGGAPVARGPSAVPGGAVLDGRPGPERLFAVCTADALPLADLERAARAAAPGGEGGVRAASRLAGLPAGALQASLLLAQRP